MRVSPHLKCKQFFFEGIGIFRVPLYSTDCERRNLDFRELVLTPSLSGYILEVNREERKLSSMSETGMEVAQSVLPICSARRTIEMAEMIGFPFISHLLNSAHRRT